MKTSIHLAIYPAQIVKTQTQQLNSTEFEVRLHSYKEIHPPHKQVGSLCVQL
jgi:hypothetical protein